MSVFDGSGAVVLLQKVSSFRSVPLFACSSHLEDLVLCTHLEDLAEPGVEVVGVGRHSALQIWRLEGDVLEGQGRRDCVENLEEKSQNWKSLSSLGSLTTTTLVILLSPARA